MLHSLFPAAKKPTVVKRGSDMLTIASGDITKATAKKINDDAVKESGLPSYTPDGAGAVLIFHTEKLETFVLGGLRKNPALSKELAKDNTPFPQQINTTIGGYLADANVNLKEAILENIKKKMFLTDINPASKEHESQITLMHLLINPIAQDDNWERNICVHTDSWAENGETKTMCFLTAIKNIYCSQYDLNRIEEALKNIMAIKKAEGASLRTLSDFTFQPLIPIIQNSLETYSQSEIVKAQTAYANHGNVVAVTFNDLAMATFAQNKTFNNILAANANSKRLGAP